MGFVWRALAWVIGRNEKALSLRVPASAIPRAIDVITSQEFRWTKRVYPCRVEIKQGPTGFLKGESRVLVDIVGETPEKTDIVLRARDGVSIVSWIPFVLLAAAHTMIALDRYSPTELAIYFPGMVALLIFGLAMGTRTTRLMLAEVETRMTTAIAFGMHDASVEGDTDEA